MVWRMLGYYNELNYNRIRVIMAENKRIIDPDIDDIEFQKVKAFLKMVAYIKTQFLIIWLLIRYSISNSFPYFLQILQY